MSKVDIFCQKNVLSLLFIWKSIGILEGDVTGVLRFGEVGWDGVVFAPGKTNIFVHLLKDC
jgi:hypothetical protein